MTNGQPGSGHPKQIVLYVLMFPSPKTLNKQAITVLLHEGNGLMQNQSKTEISRSKISQLTHGNKRMYVREMIHPAAWGGGRGLGPGWTLGGAVEL